MHEIISRARWGARYKNGFSNRSTSVIKDNVFHHSGSAGPGPNATFEQDAAAVRTLENIGQSRFKGGISYTFVVPKSGRIFEGHSINRVGAHTAGRNTTTNGICVIGNYENDTLTPQQEAAISWLVKNIPGPGRLTGGHRDFKATACPGKNAYARISAINSGSGASVNPPASGGGSVSSGIDYGGYSAKHWGKVQALLNTKGYKLDVDEVPGKLTKDALRDFQSKNGLEKDALPGPKTMAKLESKPAAPAKPQPTQPAKPAYKILKVDGGLGPESISRGQEIFKTPVDGVISNGPDGSLFVRAIQENLNHFQGENLVVDGKGLYSNIGRTTPATQTVKAIQRWLNKLGYNLKVDGILDKNDSATVRGMQERFNLNTF